MREDPTDGEDVTVIVRVEAQGPDGGVGEVTDDAIEATIDEIEALGGTVEDELRFGTLRVKVTQAQIDDLCTVSTLASIETDNTIGLEGDSGEEV
jgi:fructose-specific phosphotransferase system component IIB